MAGRDVKNGPLWEMWAIAAGVALVAFAVGVVIGDLDWNQAGFIGGLLAAVIVIVFGLPKGDRKVGPPVQAAAAATATIPVPPPVATAAPEVRVTIPVTAPVEAPPSVPLTAPLGLDATAGPATPILAAGAGMRPAGLTAPRDGRADDLKIIRGIGPQLEILCHSLGYFHFDQIATWAPEQIAWVDNNLEGFRGRVSRDRWVPQAKAIVALGPDAFLRRIDAGEQF